MGKIITFGEIMLRLEPEGYLRFLQAEKYDALYGGGEANVAVSLANFGLEVSFISKLPQHEIGQGAINALRRFGVQTDQIIRGGSRVGIYYIEKGASQRPSKVIYDRAGSSIATSQPYDFNWDNIFINADWFHFTGITPALGGRLPEICKEACQKAKEKKLTVSCDLNYRKNLWSREEAKRTMTDLMKYVDICISNEEDAKDVFGIVAPDTDLTTGKLNYQGYQYVAKELKERFGVKKVAITLRGSTSASDNTWSGMLYDGKEFLFSKVYNIHIVDRVGAGDSFGAGLIYSLISGKTSKEALEFAVAASCLKHSIEGDMNMVTVNEVEKLAGGNESGRVER